MERGINTLLQRGVAWADQNIQPFQRFSSRSYLPASIKVRLLLSLAVLSLAMSVSAQNYSINWHKVAGGGGTSTSAVYAVSGAIGQHDAGGPMLGGGYSLTGGFWSLFAVPTSGAPLLTIFRTTTNTAVISWPSPSTGWKLQQTGSLSSGSWTTPVETVNDNGANKFIVVNPPLGNRFYRLSNL